MEIIERNLVHGILALYHFRKGVLWGAQVHDNLIVSVGKAHIAGLLIGTGTAPQLIAIGDDSTPAAPGDTALIHQTHSGSSTRSLVTTTVTNDTAQYQYTFNFTSGYTITEAGLFSSSILISRRVFTGIPVVNGDSLLVQWKLIA